MVYWRRCFYFLVAAALLFRGKMIYVALYMVGSVLYLSRALVRRAFEKVHLTRHLAADRIFTGEELAVTITLHNPHWMPLVWVMVTEETPPTVVASKERKAVLSLPARGSASWTYTVLGRRRGVHTIGPSTLETGDPFGLERLAGRSETFSHLLVYPKIRPLEHLGLPSRLPFGEMRTNRRFFEDPARVIGVREYEAGDSFNRIHWKLSARTGELFVKEYQPTIALETVVFLNLNLDEYHMSTVEFTSELAIEVAASVCYYLCNQRSRVGLVTSGKDPLAPPRDEPVMIPGRKGPAQLTELLELLAKVELARGTPINDLLAYGSRHLPWGSTLIVVTLEDTPELLEATVQLSQSGYQVVVMCVHRVTRPELLRYSSIPGVYFYQVRTEVELDMLGAAKAAS